MLESGTLFSFAGYTSRGLHSRRIWPRCVPEVNDLNSLPLLIHAIVNAHRCRQNRSDAARPGGRDADMLESTPQLCVN